MTRDISFRLFGAAILAAVCVAAGCDKPKLVYAPPLPSDEAAAKKSPAIAKNSSTTSNSAKAKHVARVDWSQEKVAAETKQVHADIRRMSTAMASGDYETFYSLIHPALLNRGGDPERAKAVGIKSFKESRDSEIEMGIMEPDEPTFVEGGDSEFVLVKTMSTFTIEEKTGRSVSWQLGSRPRGETKWRYVDGSRMRRSKANFFPDLPDDFPIPEPTQTFD